MSFYQKMLERAVNQVRLVRGHCDELVTHEEHLEVRNIGPILLDYIFDEFCKSAEWPENKLMFFDPEDALRCGSVPSDVASTSDDGPTQIKVMFFCGDKTLEEHCSLVTVGKDEFEFKFGSETIKMNFAIMSQGQPVPPALLFAMFAARIITFELDANFCVRNLEDE